MIILYLKFATTYFNLLCIKQMKLTATTESTSIAELINDDAVLEAIEAKRQANQPIEVEISVGSGDSIFLETIDDEASTTDSIEVTSSIRFKTFDL